MDYEILGVTETWSPGFDGRNTADEQLEAKVKEYIAKGWRPQGGVSVAVRPGYQQSGKNYVGVVYCAQAMVKG